MLTLDQDTPLIRFDAGIATNVCFGNCLSADDTPISLPATPFQDLTFTLDGTTTYDCVVTSFQVDVAGGTLTPIRSIVAPAVTACSMSPCETVVHEPTADFSSGNRYAFGIVCRDTYPAAALGDYMQVNTYPLSESQIFPGTFVVQ